MLHVWGKKANAYRFPVGKPEGLIPPGKVRRRRKYNIKVVLE
jgi:hypothetical protein